jgi:hypothetical protein
MAREIKFKKGKPARFFVAETMFLQTLAAKR